MIVDTNKIEHNFETKDIDGFVLVNPSEIGTSVAIDLFEHDCIWESDIYNFIENYLADIIQESANKAFEVLEENNKVIK